MVNYTVQGTNGNGPGNVAALAVNWTSGPPPAPTGCVASIVTSPTTLTNAGGTATVSVAQCSPAGVTYNWSKNGASGWSTSATPAPDTLAAGGTAGYTNSYQVNVCNGSTCVNVPSANPLTAVVPGSGGGGGNIDVSGCAALGFSDARGVDVTYPTTQGNINIDNIFSTASPTGGVFGANSALVLRFTTPALGVNDSSLPNFQAEPGANGARLATIGTAPCLVPTLPTTTPPVIQVIGSQTPSFNILITASGVCPYTQTWQCSGTTYLKPNTAYYITLVNRSNYSGFGGVNTCSPAGTNCDMRFNFNQ